MRKKIFLVLAFLASTYIHVHAASPGPERLRQAVEEGLRQTGRIPEIIPGEMIIRFTPERFREIGGTKADLSRFLPVSSSRWIFGRTFAISAHPTGTQILSGCTEEMCGFITEAYQVMTTGPISSSVEEPESTESNEPFGLDDPLLPVQYHLHQQGLDQLWQEVANQHGEVMTDIRIKIGVLDSGVFPSDIQTSISRSFTGNLFAWLDTLGHGTAVAGIVCEIGGNAYLGSGVVPSCGFLADLQVMQVMETTNQLGQTQFEGYVLTEDALKALDFVESQLAVNNEDLWILIMSWGSWDRSQILTDRIASLRDRVIFVAAAGNDSADLARYPCALAGETGFDHVLCVSGVNRRQELSRFANRGINVDDIVFFPAEQIITAAGINGSYGSYYGTSFAGPIAAGWLNLIAQIRFDQGLGLTPSLVVKTLTANQPAHEQLVGLVGNPVVPQAEVVLDNIRNGIGSATEESSATQPAQPIGEENFAKFYSPEAIRVAGVPEKYATATDQVGQLVGIPSHPGQSGEIYTLWFTGLGPTQIGNNGLPWVSEPDRWRLVIAGALAEVTYIGLSPGTPGLYQINFRLPNLWRILIAECSLTAPDGSRVQFLWDNRP